MANKTAQTASFMVRFTQNIYDENGESNVQWRGNVSHVQGGEDLNFSDFEAAVTFMQTHLAQLTQQATSDKSSEEQENLLSKSFALFKSVAASGPKMIKETLKDPRRQVAHLQDQLSEVGEGLLEKVPIDQWRNASKSDFQTINRSLSALSSAIEILTNKVDALHSEAAKKGSVKKSPSPKKSK